MTPWELSATDKGVTNKTLKVKVYNPNHNCGRPWTNKLMNNNWLARIYFDDIRITPTMMVFDLREKVRHSFQCDVSLTQCNRGRDKVLRKIRGSIEEQYAKLWDYCNEIMRTNPGGQIRVAGVQTEVASFDLVISEHKQRLLEVTSNLRWLTVVGDDWWRTCRSRWYHWWTYGSWAGVEKGRRWPKLHLITDIKIENEPGWTIVSDKQKGLENAIQELLPSMEHRHYARHLHNNFKNAGFPGQIFEGMAGAEVRGGLYFWKPWMGMQNSMNFIPCSPGLARLCNLMTPPYTDLQQTGVVTIVNNE
ncbi:hypothetical protein RHSIM_Rhsim07G0127900 [Rhododendron simsii]|uniref:Uncharacterized protein n=1 Tax=Rhododendron simsii TaxID=118357 RepID=A0A834LFS0_RHOSS|nr:hypothetical protein RHSIM_Rhsim07G0127900 [Rhododendron simsii]